MQENPDDKTSQPGRSPLMALPPRPEPKMLMGVVCEELASEEALLNAACTLDSLARFSIVESRKGLSKAQADIIMHIALFGPTSMSSLAQNLAVSKEHITRAVATLEAQGLVAKRRNQENYRVVEAELTEKGVETTLALRKASLSALDKSLAGLSAQERADLIHHTHCMLELLRKLKLD